MILTSKSFEIIRAKLGKLSQSQVDGFNFLVNSFNKYRLSYPEAAYALATTWHETAGAMQPVIERGSDAYLKSKRYYPYIGYGYVQLTWKDNYARVAKLTGVPLDRDPTLALDPVTAAEILCAGMLNGWFTGVGFRKKRPVYKYDRISYIRARAIINGTDKAEAIAEYAMLFEKALRS